MQGSSRMPKPRCKELSARPPVGRSRRCFPVKPTATMPISKFMPAPAALKARTGPTCCCACISAGRNAGLQGRTFWNCMTAKRPGSSRRPADQGQNAYGWLKTESGVHRLVRISPYRQSRPAATPVSPVCGSIRSSTTRSTLTSCESDCRIDTYRASGAGGQHVNTTDSAVRITHEPTGIVVQCQNERSQHKNRATAWSMLRARLYEQELQKREEQASAERPPRPISAGATRSAPTCCSPTKW